MIIENPPVYKLPEAFLAEYKSRQPNMSIPAYVTYMRTYAAKTPEGRLEMWWETCQRVIEGAFSIVVWHQQQRQLDLNWEWLNKWAKVMYDRMFNMKWVPAGRGLQHMGKASMWTKGAAVLNNCAFISTEYMQDDPAAPFEFLMDMSMLGVGVGFDVLGAGKVGVLPPKLLNNTTWTVVDTREGWVKLLRLVIDAFANDKHLPGIIDFSNIREAGEPLGTMGGVASGPGPLIQMVWDLFEVLAPQDWGYELQDDGDILTIRCNSDVALAEPHEVRYMLTSEQISDIANIAGKCVVSGGIRRSAEIGLAPPTDRKFRDIKRVRVGLSDAWKNAATKRFGWAPDTRNDAWRWAANNTFTLDERIDRKLAQEIAESVAEWGDPGIYNRWLARTRGRLVDGVKHNDFMVKGTNPCVTADTWVDTDKGPKQVKDLIGRPFNANLHGKMFPSTAEGFFSQGNKQVYVLKTKQGHEIKLTKDHKIPVNGGHKVKAEDLRPGDKIDLNLLPDAPWGFSEIFNLGWLLGSVHGDGHYKKAEQLALLEFWGEERHEMRDMAVALLQKHFTHSPTLGRGTGDNEERKKAKVVSRELYTFAKINGLVDKKISSMLEAEPALAEGFLQGWFDADGTVTIGSKSRYSIRLSSIDYENLQAAQRILLRRGIVSVIHRNRKPAGFKEMPDGKGGRALYPCQASHDLIITGSSNIRAYMAHIGFSTPAKHRALQSINWLRGAYKTKTAAEFESLTFAGVEEVFDCTIPGPHVFGANGLVICNCGEQQLEDGELCNLVEISAPRHESASDFATSCICAFIYGKIVSLLPTHNEDVNKIIAKNRRIGVSQTGYFRALELFGRDEMIARCREGYATIASLDSRLSDMFQVNKSVRLTSIKPSGTVSLVLDVPSGIRADEAPYYIRRIRFEKTSPIVVYLREHGYPVEQDVQSPNSYVVSFPIKTGCSRGVADVSAREQLDMVVDLQTYWSDNMVSNTIQFVEAEKEQLADLIYEYGDRVKSLSFLCYNGHKYVQAPFEAITEEQYKEMADNIIPLDYALLGAYSRHDQEDKFCEGVACTIGG